MTKVRKRVHKGTTYRSGLEKKTAEWLEKNKVDYKYEDKERKIEYVIPSSVHSYLPDFILTTSKGKEIYIETKGIWDYADRYKHLLIRQQHPTIDIRFVFTRSKQRITKRSRTTYAHICEGYGRGSFKGVRWRYSDRTIPIDWTNE